MNNENKHIEFEDLIGKYLTGEANAEEIRRLEDWVTESNENARIFAGYKKIWIAAGKGKSYSHAFVEQEWSVLCEKLTPEEIHPETSRKAGKVRMPAPLLRMAAAFIILAALAGVLYYLFSKPTMVELTAMEDVVSKTLPDGSQVTLNRRSKLSYPLKFKGEERRLELDGDAYFEVTHDKEKPFIVRAGATEVKVLGTSFYMNARQDSPVVEVIVNSGKVSLVAGLQEMVINPGEKGTLSKKDAIVSKSLNEDPNFISCKTRLLVFHDESLASVFARIEQTYGVKIRVLTPAILDCRLTATFDNHPCSTVMEIIAATFGFDVRTQDGAIQVSGTTCSK
jgi:ferric-dicitrate binding protein FerR (iron transport regulator)